MATDLHQQIGRQASEKWPAMVIVRFGSKAMTALTKPGCGWRNFTPSPREVACTTVASMSQSLLFSLQAS